MKLYELLPAYQAVIDKVEAGGELTDELASELNAVVVPLEDKVSNWCLWYKALDSERAEVERHKIMLDRRIKSLTSQQEFVKQGVRNALETMGVDRLKAGISKAWVQKNSQPSLVIEDGTCLPDDFVVREERIDKESLKDYIKKGGEVEGCRLETGTHLRIS